MVYGYARVSGTGQSLEAQRAELIKHGVNVILAEKITGTITDRPELQRLLGLVKSGDKVIVVKLDRIARTVKAGLDIIDSLISKGVVVEVLNMGKFDDSPSGKLLRTMMFAFAEFERDMIVERTSEGKAIARQKPGYREGRKPVDKSIEAQILAGVGHQELGISRRTWFKKRADARKRGEYVAPHIIEGRVVSKNV